MNETPRILTNMTFRQSGHWTRCTQSLYDSLPSGALPPWREALQLYRRRSSYDIIVTMGARESLAYGLLCALTGQPSKQIMTEVFIDPPRPINPAWRVKTALYRWIARRSIGILTNSTGEVEGIAERFQLPRERIRFVPLNADVLPGSLPARDDGFILSAGRSHRDYATLLRAAADIRAPLTILCGAHDLIGVPLPPRVTLLRDVPREIYLDHLRRASIVVLPLLPSVRSTGQVVMLEAMALGKPVVASRGIGIVDYLRHEQNGLLVDIGDAAALAGAVNRLLADRALAARLGQQALADVNRFYLPDLHAKAKLAAITDLWRVALRP